MSLVEILDVQRCLRDRDQLWGFAIDEPKPGYQGDVWAFPVSGWVLGRTCQIGAVEVIYDGVLLRTIPLDRSRADVAAAHPEASNPERCGFAAGLGAVGLARQFELLVQARLPGDRRLPLATIHGRRQPIQTTFQPRLQPLMVTSLGRTGTTWLTCLLAEHPEIVAHRRYPYETFAGSYWMHALDVLSAPADHNQSSPSGNFMSNPWLIGHNPFYTQVLTPRTEPADRPLGRWLGRRYVRDLARFCQRSIDSYYRRVALKQGQARTRFFLEKYQPWHIPRMIWDLYPQAREIFLVRDFRDMVCSVLKFNAKRGYDAFGRERFRSDEEYIRQLRVGMLRFLSSWKERREQSLLLRYEDLVLKPVESLRTVLEYTGLEASEPVIGGMLERASRNPSLSRHRTSSDPRASVERWRDDLDPALRAVCEETFGDVLEAFGYPLERGRDNSQEDLPTPTCAGAR